MCGLFGRMSGTWLNQVDKTNFTSKSQFVSMTRGTDAFGVLSITHGEKNGLVDYSFLKGAINPGIAPKCPEYAALVNALQTKALLGHVRAATRGDASDSQNAHPFKSADHRFIMFHNGTLSNVHPKYETDSEWLCNRLADNKGDLKKTLDGVYGAFALVIFDSLEKTITLVRNKERTLYLSTRGNEWAYASEGWMLTGIYGDSNPELLEPFTAIEFGFKEGANQTELKEIRRYSVKPDTTFSSNYQKGSWSWSTESGYYKSPWVSDLEDDKIVYPEFKGNKGREEGVPNGTTTGNSVEGSSSVAAKVVNVVVKPYVFFDLDGSEIELTDESIGIPESGSDPVSFGDLIKEGLSQYQAAVLLTIPENFRIKSTPRGIDAEVETTKDSWVSIDDFILAVSISNEIGDGPTPFWRNRHWVTDYHYR